jgi:tetratricopeptide (TPR) repeat protein
VNKRTLVATASAAALLLVAAAASARNMHCAGGIQYVTQGMHDKDAGNLDDYSREMNKAVRELNSCAGEDPNDLDALGYLGWAYAELDSAGPAGEAFRKAIDGLAAKGDKKKADQWQNNRESYWARAYNDGIKKIGDAQGAWPEYSKTPSADEKALKDEATKLYEGAIVSLTRAKLLKPAHALTIRNLGTAYALMGRLDEAEAVLKNGQTEAASDTAVHGLAEALHILRINKAAVLLDAKNYDAAILAYQELVKQEPQNPDVFMGLGSGYFNRARTKQEAAQRADFKAAAEAYAQAFALKPTSTDLGFNAALAYQYAGELALSEAQWRLVLKQTPDDPEALSSLGSTLADMQKFDEAVQVLQRAVNLKPDNKTYFRQLGAVYSKKGDNAKSTEMLMVYMAMNTGKPSADAAAVAKTAKAGSAAASTLASLGTPESVYAWESDGRKLQTWMYTTKKQGYTFDSGAGMTLVQKSDWSGSGGSGKK